MAPHSQWQARLLCLLSELQRLEVQRKAKTGPFTYYSEKYGLTIEDAYLCVDSWLHEFAWVRRSPVLVFFCSARFRELQGCDL
jgi:hypothetical protein